MMSCPICNSDLEFTEKARYADYTELEYYCDTCRNHTKLWIWDDE